MPTTLELYPTASPDSIVPAQEAECAPLPLTELLPGVVYIPRIEDGSSPSVYSRLRALHYKLNTEGVDCDLYIERTMQEYVRSKEPHNYGQYIAAGETKHFALLVLKGTGEPHNAALALLGAGNGAYPGQEFAFGGGAELHPGSSAAPGIKSYGATPPPHVLAAVTETATAKQLLTGFATTLGPERAAQWTQLKTELAALQANANQVRRAKGTAREDISLAYRRIDQKNEEIRDLLIQPRIEANTLRATKIHEQEDASGSAVNLDPPSAAELCVEPTPLPHLQSITGIDTATHPQPRLASKVRAVNDLCRQANEIASQLPRLFERDPGGARQHLATLNGLRTSIEAQKAEITTSARSTEVHTLQRRTRFQTAALYLAGCLGLAR